MNRTAIVTLLLLAAAAPAFSQDAPSHSRVVLIVMENKSRAEVSGQPFTAGLITAGAVLTNSFGVGHPSQPNYFALWAASTLGITDDACPPVNTPSSAANLGSEIEAAGLSWRVFAEDLPAAGSTVCSFNGNTSTGLYTRKHAPWSYFTNVDHTNERPFADLAAFLTADTLPNLTIILPNNCHNTHNAPSAGCNVADGDTWLSTIVPQLRTAMGPEGVLILTWDEDDNSASNNILTVFVGPHVVPGAVSAQAVTHFTIVRTICQLFHLPSFGGAIGETDVQNIWTPVVPVRSSSWGRIKTFYR